MFEDIAMEQNVTLVENVDRCYQFVVDEIQKDARAKRTILVMMVPEANHLNEKPERTEDRIRSIND